MSSLREALKQAGIGKREGGVHTGRGEKFEIRALTFYLLARKIEFPDLKLYLQADDDALIVVEKDGNELGEYIECKKKEERSDLGDAPDPWLPANVNPSDLKGWLVKKEESVLERLSESPQSYYTMLVFGRVSNLLKPLVPLAFRNKRVPATLGWQPLQGFPLDYRHPAGKGPKLEQAWAQGFDDVWPRVRALQLEEPAQLELVCRGILERPPFRVSRSSSGRVYDDLSALIAKRRLLPEAERRILPHEVDGIIARGRRVEGAWSAIDKSPEKHLGQRAVVGSLWSAVEAQRFVVLSGPPGSGKTGLCKEIARRACTMSSAGGPLNVHYLEVRPGAQLEREREFLRDNLEERHLFIVDDEHLAHDEVERMVEAYTDHMLFAKPRARLLVTSTTTYKRTQIRIGKAGRRGSQLNLAASIMVSGSRADLIRVLRELRESGELQSEASEQTLAELSGNNLSLARMLDKAATGLGEHPPAGRLLTRPQVEQALRSWVLKSLEGSVTRSEYERQVQSVFVLAAYGIPVPGAFRDAVPALEKAGHLRPIMWDSSYGALFEAQSSRLAGILAAQVPVASRFAVIQEYVRHYPRLVPQVAGCLSARRGTRASVDQGRRLLKRLFREERNDVLRVLRDRVEPIRAADAARILTSFDRVDRKELLKELVEPEGEISGRFFDYFIQLHSCAPAELASLLDTCWTTDRYRTQRACKGLIRRREATLRELFRSPEFELDTVGSCLRALHRCDREGWNSLFEDWQEDDLPVRMSLLQASPKRLPVIVRYCSEVRAASRLAAMRTLELYASEDTVRRGFKKCRDLNHVLLFFGLLGRLHRRLAHRTLMRFVEDHFDAIEDLLRQESDLNALKLGLYWLSTFDRRLARKLARRVHANVASLMQSERNHHTLGTVLSSIRRSLGDVEARRWANALSRERLLESLRIETRSVNLVGTTLYNIHLVDPELASWAASQLDMESFLPRIRKWILPNVGYLLRGFLIASPPSAHDQQEAGNTQTPREVEKRGATEPDRTQSKGALIERMESSRPLLDTLERGWKAAPTIGESVLVIDLLLDGGMPRDSIRRLMAVGSSGSFEAQVQQRFESSSTCLEIAHGLYVLGRFDPHLARRVLEAYLQRVERARQERPRYAGFLPEKSVDLVGVGRILRVAAAIDPAVGTKLATGLDLERLVKRAVHERDLGRVRDLLSGLHAADRRAALRFVNASASPDSWRMQVEETQNFNSTIQYARSLMLVTREHGARFVLFVMDTLGDHVEAELDATASLSTAAGWLKSCVLAGVPQGAVGRLVGPLVEAAPFEGRLTSYVEASEALALVGHLKEAHDLAAGAIAHRWQVRGILDLLKWVRLRERAHRLASQLGWAGFDNELFGDDEQWHLGALLALERDGAVAGLATHVLSSFSEPDSQEVERARERARTIARGDADKFRSLIGLTLARAAEDEIEEAASRFEAMRSWELGLFYVALVASGRERDSIRLPDLLLKSARGAVQQDTADATENARYGLSVLAQRVAQSSDAGFLSAEAEAERRSHEDVRVSIRGLLNPKTPIEFWRSTPSALVQLFELTLFRVSLFDWQEEVDRAVKKDRFD